MRRLLMILPIATMILVSSLPALAQNTGAPETATTEPAPGRTVVLQDPLRLTGGVPQLIANIIKAAVGVVGALALLVFVYGGFLWLTSGGEPAKVKDGKEAMKWTAIGLIVIFSSYALVRFVLKALGG